LHGFKTTSESLFWQILHKEVFGDAGGLLEAGDAGGLLEAGDAGGLLEAGDAGGLLEAGDAGGLTKSTKEPSPRSSAALRRISMVSSTCDLGEVGAASGSNVRRVRLL